MFLLENIRGTILQGTAYWSAIDAMLAVWPHGEYSHAFARRYFDGLKGQQALAVAADLVGEVDSLNEPMMTLDGIMCFLDTLCLHQRNRYAESSRALKARLASGIRVVIRGRGTLRGVVTTLFAMPDNQHIRGTSDGYWSVHDFINVVCGKPLDDAYGTSIFSNEWEKLRLCEEVRDDSNFGPTTTTKGLRQMLHFLGDSEYGARVALML